MGGHRHNSSRARARRLLIIVQHASGQGIRKSQGVAVRRVTHRYPGHHPRGAERGQGDLVRGHGQRADHGGGHHHNLRHPAAADRAEPAGRGQLRQRHLAGQSLPGGIEEIINSSVIYLKLAQVAKETGKAWVEIPASELSEISGGNLGQLLQNNNSDPLVQTQMLASSTNVKKVGTTTLNGVPVTEYAGTYPISAGLARLPASERTKVSSSCRRSA